MDGHRSCFGSRAIITSRRCTGSAWSVMPSGSRCGRSPSRSRHRTGAGAMQASDSSALSQDDHFLPNRPRLSFRVPEPVARPGQSADFAAIAIPSAGSVARPDVSVPAGETHALAHTLIRVLDAEGGAVGPWNPGFDNPTLLRMLKDMVVVRALDGRM